MIEHEDRDHLRADSSEQPPQHSPPPAEMLELARAVLELDRRLDGGVYREAEGCAELDRAVEHRADDTGHRRRRRLED